MIGIYLITNKINGKQYVGQSVNIERRWKQHKYNETRTRSFIHKAIRKYGADNFYFDVILECPEDMLDVWEMDMIKLYDTMIPNGYNITEGGGHISDESKMMNSKRMKENNPMKNPEVANKVAEKNRGTHHNWYSEYQRELTSKRMKENNPMKNPESVKKVSKKMKGRKVDKSITMNNPNTKYKNIKQYTTDGKFIREWELVSDICKELGIKMGRIYSVLNGKQETAGGYIWRCI